MVLPYPLPGVADDYAIIVSTESAGYAYVVNMTDNDDGNLTGFSVVSEGEGTVFWMIVKNGFRPL